MSANQIYNCIKSIVLETMLYIIQKETIQITMNIQQTIREEIKQIKIIRVDRKTPLKQNVEYKDYELAFLVRQLTYHKVIAFDIKQKMFFQEDQIKRFLTDVLQQSSNQINSLITNVFRYDINGDGFIDYDELINFCTEQYLGEITIQKLNKQKVYARGAQRMISKDEFIQTIKIGLSVIDFKPNVFYLLDKFSLIDINQDGYISFQEYFQFLKDYFGSKSYAAKLINKNSVMEVMNDEKERKGPKELDIMKRYAKFQKNIKVDNIKHVDSILKFIPDTISPPMSNRGSQSVNKPSYNYNQNIYNSPRTTNSINFNVNNISLANYQKSPNNHQIQRRKRPLQNNKLQITLLQKKQLMKDSKFLIPLTPHEANIGDRIAKMVFMQLKASVIASDSNKDCLLTCQQLWTYLKHILQLNQNYQVQIFKRNNLSKQKHLNLQEAMRVIISENIIKVFKQIDNDDINRNILMSQFTTIFEKICKIVTYTPLVEKYNILYRSRTQKDLNMTLSDANALISYIFASYPLKK